MPNISCSRSYSSPTFTSHLRERALGYLAVAGLAEVVVVDALGDQPVLLVDAVPGGPVVDDVSDHQRHLGELEVEDPASPAVPGLEQTQLEGPGLGERLAVLVGDLVGPVQGDHEVAGLVDDTGVAGMVGGDGLAVLGDPVD